MRQLEKRLEDRSNKILDVPESRARGMHPIAVSEGKAVALDARIILDPECYTGKVSAYPHLVITPYPTRYVTPWRLSDGTEVILRPIRPEDEPLEHEMLTTVSPETIRSRFYHTPKQISHAMHVRSVNIDYD